MLADGAEDSGSPVFRLRSAVLRSGSRSEPGEAGNRAALSYGFRVCRVAAWRRRPGSNFSSFPYQPRVFPASIPFAKMIVRVIMANGMDALALFLPAEMPFNNLYKVPPCKIVKEVVDAVEYLSKNRQGAILVFTRHTGLRDVIQTGVKLDALISRQLIINIFSPKTPLHDGAAILSGEKIIAANCWLPLPHQEFTLDLGTRHRAAAGITSETDAIVIVVSEETGNITLATGGNLTVGLSAKQLREFLANLLQHKIEGITT